MSDEQERERRGLFDTARAATAAISIGVDPVLIQKVHTIITEMVGEVPNGKLIAAALAKSFTPLFVETRAEERRRCVQDLLDKARACRVDGDHLMAESYEAGALEIRRDK